MAPGRRDRARRKADPQRAAAEPGETGGPFPAPRARGERRADTKSERKRARARVEESAREAAQWQRPGSGKGGGRRGFARLVYWAAVLFLWAIIAAIAAIAWVGAHLPPIQSLEVPKRPPAIEIVDLGGRVLATRGDTSGPSMNSTT